MAVKKARSFRDMNLDIIDEVGGVVDTAIKPKTNKKTGRPKQNPHAQDKKLTIRVPEGLHKQLRFASVDQDKPMVEIVVDALIKHLKGYADR